MIKLILLLLTLALMLNAKEINHIKDKYGFRYSAITSPHTGKVWLDRNLGASRVCESYYDEKCFGDYFQWGRNSDGHEKAHFTSTNILSPSDTPHHSDFITTNLKFIDWKIKSNDKLWKKLYDKNNPCPKGFRIPTKNELEEETTKKGMKNIFDAFGSFLKLPAAGFRFGTTGEIEDQKAIALLWTSTTKNDKAMSLELNLDDYHWGDFYRAGGLSVRCIKE